MKYVIKYTGTDTKEVTLEANSRLEAEEKFWDGFYSELEDAEILDVSGVNE